MSKRHRSVFSKFELLEFFYISDSPRHTSTPLTTNSSNPVTAFCCAGLMLLRISYNLLVPKLSKPLVTILLVVNKSMSFLQLKNLFWHFIFVSIVHTESSETICTCNISKLLVKEKEIYKDQRNFCNHLIQVYCSRPTN